MKFESTRAQNEKKRIRTHFVIRKREYYSLLLGPLALHLKNDL
jgi:hypothetical protein